MRKIGKLPQKKGKGKLPLFCGNGERVIPIYAVMSEQYYDSLSIKMVCITVNLRRKIVLVLNLFNIYP